MTLYQKKGLAGDILPPDLDSAASHSEHDCMTVPEAELVKLRPADNQARFYRMAVWPDLFGGYSLARE